ETANFIVGIREARAQAPEKAAVGWFDWLRRPGFAMAGGFAALVLAVGIWSMAGRTDLAPVASLQLTAMRGGSPTIAPARELDLTFTDGRGRVELVDASGANLWNGA